MPTAAETDLQWETLAGRLEALRVGGLAELRSSYEGLWSRGARELPYHSLAHCYHTARVAMEIGEAMGLPREQLLPLAAAGLAHDLDYPCHSDDAANVLHSSGAFELASPIFEPLVGLELKHAVAQLVLSTATTNHWPRIGLEEILHAADMLQTAAGDAAHCRRWTGWLYEEWGKELPEDWAERSRKIIEPELKLEAAQAIYKGGYLGSLS